MKEKKICWKRINDKIIAVGKIGKKTLFLFTLPPVEKVLKSSLFDAEKKEKIQQKIKRLDNSIENE